MISKSRSTLGIAKRCGRLVEDEDTRLLHRAAAMATSSRWRHREVADQGVRPERRADALQASAVASARMARNRAPRQRPDLPAEEDVARHVELATRAVLMDDGDAGALGVAGVAMDTARRRRGSRLRSGA